MNDSVTVLVLFATVLLRLTLVAGLVWLLIPRRSRCPRCGETADRLMVPWLVRVMRLERRWCLACGWEGIAKSLPAADARAGRRSMPIAPLGAWLLVAAQGCATTQDDRGALFSDAATWIDLTYPFSEQTIYWPTAASFELESVAAGMTPDGYYYAANNFRGAEHGGTHLDAPVHFADGRHTTDQIPLAQLIGPAVVIDVAGKTSTNADYRVSVSDLEAFEGAGAGAHGRIPDGAIVLFRTGWGAHWPDAKAYLGTDVRGEAAIPELHFPGIDSAAARWLVTNRSIDAVGSTRRASISDSRLRLTPTRSSSLLTSRRSKTSRT